MCSVPVVRVLLLAAWAVTAASCSDSSSPPDDSRPPGELNVIRVATISTPLLNSTVSFYARSGENTEAAIFFQDGAGGQGEEYARLQVDANSLLALPDSTPILTGDSVLITLSVVDPTEMLFDVQPAGLKFTPLTPARLTIHYDHANGDLNNDGRADGRDDSIERTLDIWRQETPNSPFVRLHSTVTIDIDQAEAELTGLSRYAIAY